MRLIATVGDTTGPVDLEPPDEVNVLERTQKIIALTGSKSKTRFALMTRDSTKQRKPDISLAERLLDWIPCISPNDGL